MLRSGGFFPNSFTFPPLISGGAKLGYLSLGRMCHGHALKFGVDNILAVQNSLVYLYASSGRMHVERMLFDEMPTKDVISWNTIIDGYAKDGEMGLAHKLFDAMPEKSVVSWNIMINGYLSYRNPGNALKLFIEMIILGFRSNDITAVGVITACGRCCRLKEGKSVHGFVIKFSPPCLSVIIDTAVVDMYSKCGRTDIAHSIFNRMPTKNLVSWNAMILGHCIHGNPESGLRLYSEMMDTTLPDAVTFIGVLCGCFRLGKLQEGRGYFSQMVDEFHLKPNFAHYWCMANLMANAGLMQDAIDILTNIPAAEDEDEYYSLWGGLFGSCRFLGDVGFGEGIAKKLIEVDPREFSRYNLLVNVFAAAGRWEDVAKTKSMMKERGIHRQACCNLKDLEEIASKEYVGIPYQLDERCIPS